MRRKIPIELVEKDASDLGCKVVWSFRVMMCCGAVSPTAKIYRLFGIYDEIPLKTRDDHGSERSLMVFVACSCTSMCIYTLRGGVVRDPNCNRKFDPILIVHRIACSPFSLPVADGGSTFVFAS